MKDQIFRINPELDIPIYQQLVDTIRTAVKKGDLIPNQQLPTVQELSEKLGIARGTIKRAYDELERAGIVEKAHGSRKEQAMAAIDAMLDEMEEMGFSATEIGIFLELKMRERAEEEVQIKVAVLECNPENLSHMTEQLHRIPKIDLYSYLLDAVKEYPYKLGEEMDLVVTTASHAQFLERVIPERRKIAKIAICLTQQSLSDIIRLRKGKRVGILAYSQRFGQLLHDTCLQYTEGVTLSDPLVFSPELDVVRFLEDKDAVLVPRDYEKYCDAYTAQCLERFRGRLVECSYEMDAGSFLYLQEKTRRLLEEKQL